jgi:hypothetical protein
MATVVSLEKALEEAESPIRPSEEGRSANQENPSGFTLEGETDANILAREAERQSRQDAALAEQANQGGRDA